MDIRCPKCGEPWEIDSLHEVDGMTFAQARKKFYKVGCEVFDSSHGYDDSNASLIAQMGQELMGDDVDGLASMMDDAEFFGLI